MCFNVDSIRRQFPALPRQHNGQPIAYFDGPAGSQVPRSVAEAVAGYLLVSNRRERLAASFAMIQEHERQLAAQLLKGLKGLPGIRVWGITDTERWEERVPTISITHAVLSPQQLAAALATDGLYTWAGNHCALPFTEAAGLEPNGTLRIGLLHYNTSEEIERLLKSLDRLLTEAA